jgi:predicted nucleic acid-binding protein
VVLDTNVFISGLDEYRRVGERLARTRSGIDLGPFLALLVSHGDTVSAPPLPEPLCEDSTDDMFFACAVAAGCSVIVSGDKHLHHATGYRGIEVLRPRAFVERYLGGDCRS